MNKQPITQAIDRDLRLSQVTIQRAALRAQDLTKATGAANDIIEHLIPKPQKTPTQK